MNQQALFTCNVLQSKGKLGNLKSDDNGYYEVCVGALDAFNDVGELYAYTPNVVSLFEPNGRLNQRLAQKNVLHGEVGHPKRMPGESAEAFMQRAITINESNECVHYKSVRIEDGKDEHGRHIKLVIAKLTPSGVHHAMMDKKLKNPDENVAFSIRCLTKPVMIGGKICKEIFHVITWDYVNEPGIACATKYDSPSMESAKADIIMPDNEIVTPDNDIILTPEMLTGIETKVSTMMGMESANDQIRMIRSSLGWQQVQVLPTRSATNL